MGEFGISDILSLLSFIRDISPPMKALAQWVGVCRILSGSRNGWRGKWSYLNYTSCKDCQKKGCFLFHKTEPNKISSFRSSHIEQAQFPRGGGGEEDGGRKIDQKLIFSSVG